ncbi:putative ABC transporter permease subunit [Bacillus sp. AK128]
MMKVLLANQWRIYVNTLKSQPSRNYIGYFFMLIILGIFLALISTSVLEIGSSITEPLFAGIASYGFLMMIGFILLLGLPQVFKNLYSATDLQLLFTMPIPTRHIFWLKYLQSFFGVPLLMFILFIVPVFMYGIIWDVHVLFYPVVVLVLLSVIIIGMSFAYLFNLILIQIVPASRANEFMTVMSVLSGVFVYLLFMLPNTVNDEPLTDLLLKGLPLFPDWVPVAWASHAIVESMSGSLQFALPLLMIISLAIVLMLVTSTLVERGFRTGWVRLSEGSGKRKKKSRTNSQKSGLRHPVIALGVKEWYAIKRDLREWLVFMPLIFFFVFGAFGFLSSGGELSDLQGPSEVTWVIAQGIFLFIYSMFNGSVASATVAREGNSLWILQMLPLTGKDIAVGKLWISWLIPFLVLTVIEIVIGLFLQWTFLQFIGGIIMKAVITAGISGLGLWIGTIGAKYNPANPQNRLTFSSGFILVIVSYVYVLLAFIPYVLLLVPTDAISFVQEISRESGGFIGFVAGLVATMLSWKAASPVAVWISGILLMVIFSLGVTFLTTKASARRFDKGIKIEMVQGSRSSLGGGKAGGFFRG